MTIKYGNVAYSPGRLAHQTATLDGGRTYTRGYDANGKPAASGWYDIATGQTVGDIEAYERKMLQAKSLSNPASYNPGVNYMADLKPWLGNINSAISSLQTNIPQTNVYENKLLALMDNPDSISDTGAYKFRYDQGQKALERSAAAKGQTGSGNVLAELSKYGQGQASQAYNTEADRLAALTGQQKQYMNSTANTLASLASAGGGLTLGANRAKSDDYWNAQQAASNIADQSNYYRQLVW